MLVNHIFGELIALAIPFGASYLTTKFLPFAPLFSKTTTIPANLAFLPSELYTYLHANNDIAISLIPTMIYIIGRVYFEIMYFITSLIPIPQIAKYTTYLQIWVGILGPFFHPTIQTLIIDLFNETFGNISSVVYELSKPEWIKAYDFSQKIGYLILGWFALFLIFEFLLRILFLLLVLAYNSIWGKKKTTTTAETITESNDPNKSEDKKKNE
eukprot:gene7466-8053_t